MTTRAKSLQERANEVRNALSTLELRRTREGRGFTPDEERRVDALLTEQSAVDRERERQLNLTLASRSADASDPVANPDGRRYSLLRAINRVCERKQVDGYEGELSQEIARRSGLTPKGFYMPFNLPNGERRDITATTGAGAIQTSIVQDRFIDLLRAKTALISLGATILPDVVGPFAIPKITAGTSAYWVAEANAPTESAPTVGQLAFSPLSVGAFVDITRKLVKQTGSAAERLLRSDLASMIGTELDRVGIVGDDGSGEPLGLLNDTDIPTVAIGTDGGVPTWAKVVELESTVTQANADRGMMGYLTSPTGRGLLKTTPVVATHPEFLWDRNDRVNGYRAASTNNVPVDLTKGTGEDLTALIFGDFSTVFIAMWGGLDILVDPYSLSTTGGIRLSALLECQIKFRHPESLAKIVDMGAGS
jgi:HK97 family phage major capsid protein